MSESYDITTSIVLYFSLLQKLVPHKQAGTIVMRHDTYVAGMKLPFNMAALGFELESRGDKLSTLAMSYGPNPLM